MDSTAYVAILAILLFALIWTTLAARDRGREIQRHKDAAIKYRAYVVQQKATFIHNIIERLDLRTRGRLPGLDVGLYSRIIDLYDQAEFIPYPSRVEAINEFNIRWTCEIRDLDDEEVFVLWFEFILERAKPTVLDNG